MDVLDRYETSGSEARETPVEAVPGRRPDEFLIGQRKDSCRECWGCVRHCPARAIRVTDGRSYVIPERCVKCGACVLECGHSAHTVRDDIPGVRALLASGRPVVAILATEFVAAMHPMRLPEIESALEAIGFHSVETTVIAEELVATAYERSHARSVCLPRLRSTCPVVVSWVRKYYPQLSAALEPIVPPYIAQARLVKELYPEGTAVAYVSPCFARKDEIFEADVAGAVDVAIDFGELKKLLDERLESPRLVSPVRAGGKRPEPIKEISLTDGFPRKTISDRDETDTCFAKVRGLRALDDLLGAIVRGEAAPSVIDMLNCDGCIDGPAVNRGMSVFAKRNLVSSERGSQRPPRVSTRELLGYLPRVDLIRSFSPTPVVVTPPSDEEIDETLAKGEFHSREDTIDCGACGYDTCVEHAVAIIEDHSSWEVCFPLQRRVLQREADSLRERALLDPLTGLGNRRLFDSRLAEETARSRRYGLPLGLIMFDLDGFKHVNDDDGHLAGDAVLKHVGEILKHRLRESDVAIRYGGDEFAIILPGVSKTEAFFVAEELRGALRGAPVAVDLGDAGTRLIGITASFGVAAFSDANSSDIALLEKADSALYRAKEAGRDRVELAAD